MKYSPKNRKIVQYALFIFSYKNFNDTKKCTYNKK